MYVSKYDLSIHAHAYESFQLSVLHLYFPKYHHSDQLQLSTSCTSVFHISEDNNHIMIMCFLYDEVMVVELLASKSHWIK